MTIRIGRPPKDLDSFIGRKWLETINRNNAELDSVLNLPFLLDVVSALLPNARAFTVASNLIITDGGPGGNFQISLNLNNGNIWTADQSVPDEAYGAGWNGSLEVPTKNALYDKIEAVVAAAYTDEQAQDAVGAMINATLSYVDGTPLLTINLGNANTWTADQSVPDEAYGVGWNGSMEVPTKNAVYDKIEAVVAGGVSDMDARRLIHLGY